MSKFRKKPPFVSISGGNGFITRVSTVVDSNNDEQRVTSVDSPEHYVKDYPPLDVFSLKSKIESGVTLKEEDSVVFKSDSLSPSEVSKINSVLDKKPDDSNETDGSEH